MARRCRCWRHYVTVSLTYLKCGVNCSRNTHTHTHCESSRRRCVRTAASRLSPRAVSNFGFSQSKISFFFYSIFTFAFYKVHTHIRTHIHTRAHARTYDFLVRILRTQIHWKRIALEW
uniref:Uncharacterized protein n=1 Tax=Anopheles darlingi TaxID=43151 RepID=A0A2M4CXR5_ANODA